MSQIRNLYYLKAFGYEFIDKKPEFKATNKDFKHLSAQISNCALCTLSKRRKHCVMDAFKPHKLMIIDSFISKSENDSGVLLSSSKGEKLKSSLKECLNLDPEGFYLSYLYKCFSESKSDENALKQCMPYVFEEFFLLRPKVLLILGSEAFEALGFGDFERFKGELFSYQNAWALGTYDMNFLLKNPSFEPEFKAHLKKIKALI